MLDQDIAEKVKQQIHTIMLKHEDSTPSIIAPMIEQALFKIQAEHVSLREALDLSDEMIEEIYDYGYRLFQSGKYQEALTVFSVLRELHQTDLRFTFAIAACHHYTKNYPAAAGYYLLYEALDPTNPLPYYHLYDCFTKMGQFLLAIDTLKLADQLAANKPQYSELKNKIEMELEHLKTLDSHFHNPKISKTSVESNENEEFL